MQQQEEIFQPKFGPEGFDKIAIIGSAPSSIALGPYNDPSWAVWGCSPGAYGYVPRSEVWWEIHRWEPANPGVPMDATAKPWFSPEYCDFLRRYAGTVMMATDHADVPHGVRAPFEELIKKHGPYHFTSSIAWMIALALEFKPKAIGLWGVDMAATSEYAFQRPGLQHFLGLATQMGIEVVLPPESDLMRPTTMYGISEYSPRHIKLLARKNELQNRLNEATNRLNGASAEMQFLRGALDDLEYMSMTWIDDVECDLGKAASASRNVDIIHSVHGRNILLKDLTR
jgi:hypothetical protein